MNKLCHISLSLLCVSAPPSCREVPYFLASAYDLWRNIDTGTALSEQAGVIFAGCYVLPTRIHWRASPSSLQGVNSGALAPQTGPVKCAHFLHACLLLWQSSGCREKLGPWNVQHHLGCSASPGCLHLLICQESEMR